MLQKRLGRTRVKCPNPSIFHFFFNSETPVITLENDVKWPILLFLTFQFWQVWYPHPVVLVVIIDMDFQNSPQVFSVADFVNGKSILQVPDTGTRVLVNTKLHLRSSIVSFWITPARSKGRKYHIFRQYWYTRNVPVFTNTGTFQYLGPEVYFFLVNYYLYLYISFFPAESLPILGNPVSSNNSRAVFLKIL